MGDDLADVVVRAELGERLVAFGDVGIGLGLCAASGSGHDFPFSRSSFRSIVVDLRECQYRQKPVRWKCAEDDETVTFATPINIVAWQRVVHRELHMASPLSAFDKLYSIETIRKHPSSLCIWESSHALSRASISSSSASVQSLPQAVPGSAVSILEGSLNSMAIE